MSKLLLASCLPILASAVACSVDATETDESEGALGQTIYGLSDFEIAPTIHLGEIVEDNLAVRKGKIAHPFYVGADANHPVVVSFAAMEVTTLRGDSAKIPIAMSILGPADGNGNRAVIDVATGGIETALETPGQYLLVVGAKKGLKGRVVVQSSATGASGRAGALVKPEHGAILAKNTLSVRLNPKLSDTNVELWASAPMPLGAESKRRVGAVRTVNHLANFVLDGSVREGDDLTVIVPSAVGPAYDTGVLLRYWPRGAAGLRSDRTRTSVDERGVSIAVTGVLDYVEGDPTLELRSMDRTDESGAPLLLAALWPKMVLPGQSLSDHRMIDESFTLPLGQRTMPRTGELLAIGASYDETGSFAKLACIRFDQTKSVPIACPNPEGAWTDIDDAFSLARDEQHALSIPDVPAGVYTFKTRGSGDADLYVKVGGPATLDSFDCRPYAGGTAESCTVTLREKATIGVMVHGFRSSVVQLTGTRE